MSNDEIFQLCDGFAEIDDLEYKKFYRNKNKNEQTLFPFIYHMVEKIEGWEERIVMLIPKNRKIVVINGEKRLKPLSFKN